MKSQPTTGRLTDARLYKRMHRMVPTIHRQQTYEKRGTITLLLDLFQKCPDYECYGTMTEMQHAKTTATNDECKKPCYTVPTVIRHRCLVTGQLTYLLGYQVVSWHHQAQVPYVVYDRKIDMCPVLDCMRYCCGTKKFMVLCPYMT